MADLSSSSATTSPSLGQYKYFTAVVCGSHAFNIFRLYADTRYHAVTANITTIGSGRTYDIFNLPKSSDGGRRTFQLVDAGGGWGGGRETTAHNSLRYYKRYTTK